MVNLSFKFEVSNSTHYIDRKGNAKYRKCGIKSSYGLFKLTGWKEHNLMQQVGVPLRLPL